jgi:hypothetical protein
VDSLRRHKYTYGIFGAGVLLIVGTLVVLNRAGISQVGGPTGLDTIGELLPTNRPLPIPVTPPPVIAGVGATTTKIPTPTPATPPPVQPPPREYFDWNSFVTALTHYSVQGNMSTSATPEAYAYIPTGLFTPHVQVPTANMTNAQKALYGWGNDAGAIIISFETSHPNQPSTLTNFIQDRQNPLKIAAMKQLGDGLAAVGDGIDNVGDAPTSIKSAAHGLANAYRDIGTKLAAIPDAQGDDATVKAILTYDKAAEAFIGKFVDVVTIFQASDIQFTQGEPGSVFMFPSN